MTPYQNSILIPKLSIFRCLSESTHHMKKEVAGMEEVESKLKVAGTS